MVEGHSGTRRGHICTVGFLWCTYSIWTSAFRVALATFRVTSCSVGLPHASVSENSRRSTQSILYHSWWISIQPRHEFRGAIPNLPLVILTAENTLNHLLPIKTWAQSCLVPYCCIVHNQNAKTPSWKSHQFQHCLKFWVNISSETKGKLLSFGPLTQTLPFQMGRRGKYQELYQSRQNQRKKENKTSKQTPKQTL